MLKFSPSTCGPAVGLAVACWLLCWPQVLSAADQTGGEVMDAPRRSLRVQLPGQEHSVVKTSWSGIGCWFWTAEDFQPDAYKRFVDLHERHSGYGLLTTSIRHHVEVTQPEVHDQIKRATEYARAHGMEVVMDLDVRLARQAFMDKYPGELQEIVRLRELALEPEGPTVLAIDAIQMADHYTPTQLGVRAYESLAGRLLRAYAYVAGPQGIEPDGVQDITSRCQVTQADARGVKVTIPGTAADQGRTACLLAAFTLFTPDVFAPHLPEFERNTLRQYADVPLAGACKDEWGFPGRFGPRLDDLYFSQAMADVYARRRPGRNLVRDLLLMVKPHQGLEAEREAAINHYMEMNWQRNAEVENAYYRSIKDVFGPQAMSATHPTWFPNPSTREEVFKNGLHWWACRRDLAQTDEATPFCARTALAKKWHSPLWVNMYYERTLEPYREDLWRHALGGGRINFHPIYPAPANVPPDHRTVSLLGDKLLAADCRVRLLNFISTAPLDCPVAVVFGHPAALNWAGPGLADTGLAVTDRLWAEGFYADLIPSSEIAAGALVVGEDGRVQYGAQRYDAVVLYQPQFERAAVADFFRQAAAAGKTSLYRVGDWTRDFEGQSFDGQRALPEAMRALTDAETCARAVIAGLRAAGRPGQTLCTVRGTVGFAGSMMPRPSGQCRLLDGTVILASGAKDVMGDPIQTTITVDGHDVTFDAVGVAAVRLDPRGQVAAMAAGGLKASACGDLHIQLPDPADIALWRDAQGQWQGVLQGHTGPIPDALTRITKNWTRLRLPAPLENEREN
jgi:hypothetical protein